MGASPSGSPTGPERSGRAARFTRLPRDRPPGTSPPAPTAPRESSSATRGPAPWCGSCPPTASWKGPSNWTEYPNLGAFLSPHRGMATQPAATIRGRDASAAAGRWGDAACRQSRHGGGEGGRHMRGVRGRAVLVLVWVSAASATAAGATSELALSQTASPAFASPGTNVTFVVLLAN